MKTAPKSIEIKTKMKQKKKNMKKSINTIKGRYSLKQEFHSVIKT